MQSQWHIHDLCILIMVWHTFYFASLEHNHSSYGQCSHYSHCNHTTYSTSHNGPSVRRGHWMDKRVVTISNMSPRHSLIIDILHNRTKVQFTAILKWGAGFGFNVIVIKHINILRINIVRIKHSQNKHSQNKHGIHMLITLASFPGLHCLQYYFNM